MSIWDHIKAALSLVIITLNLAFWCLPVFLLGLTKGVIPLFKGRCDALLEWIYRAALRIDDLWLQNVMGLRWTVPMLDLPVGGNVIVISNHVSWADVLLIQSIISRRGPILKFLAKRQLMYIPIFGAIFWAFDFPILRRSTRPDEPENDRRRRDQEALKDACRILATRPGALVNFAEGTRFSEEKRQARSSPFVHLLPPKVGGFSAILDALGVEDLKILDITLAYPESHSFWTFLSGKTGAIEITAETFDASTIPKEREGRAAWLEDRWRCKDQWIESRITAAAPVS